MTTQQYMGRNSLLKRLTAQVGGNEEMARKILIDRASKRTGTPKKDYTYNPASNTASLRRR